MGSKGATSQPKPPDHFHSDPCTMRVFLTVLLVAAARADKPAVAPAYTGAATVDETFGSTLKRDAPAAAAPDSYGSPIAAPAQDTYGSPSAPVASSSQPDSYGSPAAPVVAQQDSYGSPQAPVQTAPQSAGPGNQGYYYYPVRQNVPEAESDDGGLLGGLLGGGLAGLLTTKALLLILGLAGFVLIATIGIGFSGRRSFSSRALSMASPYMTSGNLIALLESVNSAITKYQ